jgi:hypothetical protein
MNLQQARDYLAPYIENGRCSDETQVRTVINEAQRRLHSMGDWIGTVRRWGVTVNTSGEFLMPTGAETVMRIAELAPGMAHSTQGVTVSSDAYAFVFDSPSLLRFSMIRPGVFKVLGPYPTAVDVMGKVAYRDAVFSPDILTITDRDALKLMVMGIWNENNNAPELANELIGKAAQHLATKTQVAVESAKSALFQNMLSTCAPGTRGYARAKVSLATTGGDRQTDAQMAEILDDAEKRIMCQTQFWHSYLCKAVGGYFAVPHEIESILRVDIDNIPTKLNGPTVEYIETGVGYREATYGGHKGAPVNYRGDFALQADLPYETTMTVRTSGTCRGVNVVIVGKNSSGEEVREVLSVDGGSVVSTSQTYADVTSITAAPRDGTISFTVDNLEVALLQPFETDSKRARYSIPSSDDCKERILRILGRARWIPKIRDEQRMQVDNTQALVLMAAAIQLERAGKFQESEAMEAKAIRLVEQEARNKNAGLSVTIDKHPTGANLNKANGGR